jgi:hypothetical protein
MGGDVIVDVIDVITASAMRQATADLAMTNDKY